MRTTITNDEFILAVEQVATELQAAQELLRELDAAMGDGDLGITMKLGFDGVRKVLPDLKGQDIGTIVTKTGLTFNSSAASTMGALLASAGMRAGREVKGKTEIDLSDLVRMAHAGVTGIRDRGKADVGDKTMLDTLVPWADALNRAAEEKKSLAEALAEALPAAERGMLSTRGMMPKAGRGSWLGERTKDVQDPGATASFLMIKSFSEYLMTH
jgi:phosphoenolpyruvate---glycerone phosphotransferase subunit DhaL